MSNVYASIEELRARIDSTGVATWSAADLSNMDTALRAASRWIDERLDTRFYTANETRFYTPLWPDLLYVDDMAKTPDSVTLYDRDGTIAAILAQGDDYDMEPGNALVKGRPYRQIRIRPGCDYRFTTGVVNSVEVRGDFGYSAEPPGPIRQAALLLAQRLWMRKDAVFGVAGTPGLGVTVVQARIETDSDILAMLNGVGRRYV